MSILPFFLLKKSILDHFAIRSTGKCHFDPILDPFWALLTPTFGPGQNVPICSLCPDGPWRDLEGPEFDLILTILDPFWGSWREVAARPRTSCLWVGGPVWSLSNPCPKPQILVILTTFPIEKVNFVILPIRGQWKCHFDPILTPFWALLNPNFGLPPKCAYLYPLSWRTLEGPWGTLFWP